MAAKKQEAKYLTFADGIDLGADYVKSGLLTRAELTEAISQYMDEGDNEPSHKIHVYEAHEIDVEIFVTRKAEVVIKS